MTSYERSPRGRRGRSFTAYGVLAAAVLTFAAAGCSSSGSGSAAPATHSGSPSSGADVATAAAKAAQYERSPGSALSNLSPLAAKPQPGKTDRKSVV